MSTAAEQIERVQNFGDGYGRFAESWVGYALRTAPIEPDVIIPAINDLYELAGFSKPRVVIVPSPGVLAFAGTFAADVWASRATNPTFDPARCISSLPDIPAQWMTIAEATLQAFQAATTLPPLYDHVHNQDRDIYLKLLDASYSPAGVATSALDEETILNIREAAIEMESLNYWYECMRDAMSDEFGVSKPTELMASAACDWAYPLAFALFGNEFDAQRVIRESANWEQYSEAGNLWLFDTARIAAARDLHHLDLPEHQGFSVWERFKFNGGYRYLHPEFCLVSDFPEILDEASMDHPMRIRRKTLQQRRDAPIMQWRDGWLI